MKLTVLGAALALGLSLGSPTRADAQVYYGTPYGYTSGTYYTPSLPAYSAGSYYAPVPAVSSSYYYPAAPVVTPVLGVGRGVLVTPSVYTYNPYAGTGYSYAPAIVTPVVYGTSRRFWR